ncbi:MAG: PDR/VanB family oxidoreductase [Pseudomonadota bacterium]|nr:PDR/VanB family oxidoreductase [Pseudomonadota bacterium]
MSDTTSLTLTVTERFDDRGDIMRLTLAPEPGTCLPAVTAGAHIDLAVDLPDGPGWRQYSLYGDPSEAGVYRVGILKDPVSRGGSVALHAAIRTGQTVTVEGPRNHFAVDHSAKRSVLFGGGIGITPMLAMAYELHAKGAAFTLHYATRSADRAAFLDLIESAPFAENVVLHHDDATPLDLAAALPTPEAGTHVYVCGPQGFMDWIINSAEAAGFASSAIHREYFSADVDTGGASFVVYAAQSDITVTVGPEDTIAKALAREGLKIEVKCEEGICGTCVTDVLEGEIDHRDQFLTEEEREDGDQICACCSRACSDRLVLDV